MTTGEIPQKITMIAGIPQQSKSTGGYEPSKMKSTKLCSEQIRQRLLHSSYIYVRIYNYSCSHACITNSQLRVYITRLGEPTFYWSGWYCFCCSKYGHTENHLSNLYVESKYWSGHGLTCLGGSPSHDIYIICMYNGSAKTLRIHEFYTPLQKQL